MGAAITEEHTISWDQYLDLVYSHSGTLYDLIPNAHRPNTDPAKPLAETLVDGVVGSIQPPSTVKPTKQQSSSPATSSTPTFSVEVNAVHLRKHPIIRKRIKR